MPTSTRSSLPWSTITRKCCRDNLLCHWQNIRRSLAGASATLRPEAKAGISCITALVLLTGSGVLYAQSATAVKPASIAESPANDTATKDTATKIDTTTDLAATPADVTPATAPQTEVPEVPEKATLPKASSKADAPPSDTSAPDLSKADPPPAEDVNTDAPATATTSNPSGDTPPTQGKTDATVSPETVDTNNTSEDTTVLQPNMDMAAVIALLQKQQQELAAQRQILESQTQQITVLNQELDAIRGEPKEASKELVSQREQLNSQSQKIASLTLELNQLKSAPATSIDPEKKKKLTGTQLGGTAIADATVPESSEATTPQTRQEKSRAAERSVAVAQSDDPTRSTLEDFSGGWNLPGTDAYLRIGGYVKTAVVYNFDPMQIKDRFIVGSIPVGDAGNDDIVAQSSITADQSRLNFDLREPTEYGVLRAFIEGDFAGGASDDENYFRLRHAFGQWKRVLAGKTWSAFMDPESTPEDIDFEGLNGRINVRQAQVRVMPAIGEDYELQVSLEDPNPEIQNGTGVSKMPDLVVAGQFTPNKDLHLRMALLSREIRAQRTGQAGVEQKTGWGATVSGRFNTPGLDDRDVLLFQVNYGNGIGRYVNDLASVGNFDGIFNPDEENGKLKLLDVFAGYVSWQHWWGVANWRSNFTVGYVNLDSPDFADGDAYERTIRATSNVIWSPTPRIDLGAELLWGKREDVDGENGDATQLQMSVKYQF
jgi:hypothetical protein